MRRVVASVACIALIAVAVQMVAAGSSIAAPQVSTIDWGRCSDAFLREVGSRCGMLEVPLDYDDPTGQQIRIALARVRHTVPEAEYQGVMLVNPGGPGGSGSIYSVLGQFVPDDAGAAYDWIGFDPRGVGSSRPALSCIPRYFGPDRPPYVPKTEALEAKWLARAERYANACQESAPELLPHMTTVDTVRDMDSIRQALGVQEINFYGFSYGTYLGQVFATMFPGVLRRVVFDGTVDPRDVWYQLNLEQDIGFDRNIRIWFHWVAAHRRAYRLGRTEEAVERKYLQAQRTLKRHPAGGIVGPSEWADIFLYSGYFDGLWPYLGNVFSSWVHRGAESKLIGAFRAFDAPGYDNPYAVYLAVECTDAQWPQDWATWSDDNWATHEIAPLITWGNAWFNAPCFFWPAPASSPVTVVGDDTPALMISQTLDAATPYEGSLYVRSLFDNAALVAEVGGITHAGSLGGNACVDDRIAAFLATGELPARLPGDTADVECEPLPHPRPRIPARTEVSRLIVERVLRIAP
jgi:pimeloyl-ACP methyl ester carboxylesterase